MVVEPYRCRRKLRPHHYHSFGAYCSCTGKQIWHSGSATSEDKGLSAFRQCDVPRWTNCTCQLDIDRLEQADLEDIMAPDLDTAMQAYPGR